MVRARAWFAVLAFLVAVAVVDTDAVAAVVAAVVVLAAGAAGGGAVAGADICPPSSFPFSYCSAFLDNWVPAYCAAVARTRSTSQSHAPDGPSLLETTERRTPTRSPPHCNNTDSRCSPAEMRDLFGSSRRFLDH